MAIFSKLKKVFKLIGKINIYQGIKYKIFYKLNGYFLPYKNSYFDIQKKAKITINNNSKFYFNQGRTKDPNVGILQIEKNGELIVNGNFQIYTGAKIYILEGGIVELGEGFINHNLMLVCREHIKIGYGVMISNNVVIRDNDAHEIIGENYESKKSIEIGNHVWIGTNVTILKGVKIGDGAVIGANSLVNKSIPSKTMAAGVPAKVIKENIEWR